MKKKVCEGSILFLIVKWVLLASGGGVISFLFMTSLSTFAADENRPFNVRNYGSFRKIIESKNPEGVVGLEYALSAPHTYAVGEIKNAEGEITVYNSEVWLNYGEDGMSVSTNEIPKGEKAMQLVSAQVEKWQEIIVPKNMSDNDLYHFVLDQARKLGLNVKSPFPCVVEGEGSDLVWHVLQEADVRSDEHEKKLFFTKLVEYREHASVILIGFCSEIRDGYSLPGEFWHMHVLFRNEKTAGHIDAFSVAKGAKLRLPIK